MEKNASHNITSVERTLYECWSGLSILKEKISRKKIIGVISIIVGVVCIAV